jgi:hypothetical protein
MPYSLLSRGRLFGQSDLSYAQAAPWMRAGDFIPSKLGHRLMPIILSVGPTLRALHEAAARVWLAERDPDETEWPDDWPASVKHSSEFADAVSLQDEIESLALALHDPDGNLVATESIWLQDSGPLIARAHKPSDLEHRLRRQPRCVERRDDLDPPTIDLRTLRPCGVRPNVRYQILITLAGMTKSLDQRRKRAG